MDRWSLYDLGLDLQGHENPFFFSFFLDIILVEYVVKISNISHIVGYG